MVKGQARVIPGQPGVEMPTVPFSHQIWSKERLGREYFIVGVQPHWGQPGY